MNEQQNEPATEPAPPVWCEYFAKCDHEAVGMVAHPVILGGVPTCQRCADKLGLEFASRFPAVAE